MNSTLFTDAMALTPAGDGVYDGELNEHWTIGAKVHGGAMLALCANAARMEHAEGAEPIAVSGNFLWAPEPGAMRVVTTVRKRGRRISLIDVELRQGVRTGDVGALPSQAGGPPARRAGGRSREEQKVAVRAAVTLGDPDGLGTDGSAHRVSACAARRRLAARFVHDGADRPGLVRRGPHRRRLRGPHHRAEPTIGDGAGRAVTVGRMQCFPAWPESRSLAVEASARHCCPGCCGPGGRSRSWWSPRRAPSARSICRTRIRCW